MASGTKEVAATPPRELCMGHAAIKRVARRANIQFISRNAQDTLIHWVDSTLIDTLTEAARLAKEENRRVVKPRHLKLPGRIDAPIYPKTPVVPEPAARPGKKPCFLCSERIPSTITVPCGHRYACVTCAAAVRPKKCHMCRKPIQGMYKINKQK
jgi:histone H3/H4